MNEQQLATLCKNGNRNALRLLYDRYATWMMGISMRYVGNEDVSKDILHDSFVQILGSIDRFEYRGNGSLKAWINRIVVNTALAFLKKHIAYSSLEEDYLPADMIVGNNVDEEDIMLSEALSEERLIECVGKLPPRLRVVFNLFIFEDVSHRDIARELGISEQASRVRFHRAKSLLAIELRGSIKSSHNERG